MLNNLQATAPAVKDRKEVSYLQVTGETFAGQGNHRNAIRKARRITAKWKKLKAFKGVLEKQYTAHNIKPIILIIDVERSNLLPFNFFSTNNYID